MKVNEVERMDAIESAMEKEAEVIDMPTEDYDEVDSDDEFFVRHSYPEDDGFDDTDMEEVVMHHHEEEEDLDADDSAFVRGYLESIDEG